MSPSLASSPASADPSLAHLPPTPAGSSCRPTDHVYVSAPWDDREGEPYIVARVVEILQPQPAKVVAPSDTSSSTAKGDSAASPPAAPTSNTGSVGSTDLRVRVAYYFRTRDITNRYVADHRLIVATMHADTVPASYIRGLCTVKHRDHIEKLEVYKREDDTFYWHQARHALALSPLFARANPADRLRLTRTQLYDRYLHRYFDAVPTYKVSNAPRASLPPPPPHRRQCSLADRFARPTTQPRSSAT